MIFDFIIIGAGLSGSYAASKLIENSKTVLVLEKKPWYRWKVFNKTDFK